MVLESNAFCMMTGCDILKVDVIVVELYTNLYQGRHYREINTQHMRSRNQSKQPDQNIGILNVYKLKSVLNKKKIQYGQLLPLVFRARLQKGAEPVYINYQTIRDTFPLILLGYFQEKANLKILGEDQNTYFPTNHKYQCDTCFQSAEIKVVKEEQHERKRNKKESRDNLLIPEVKDKIYFKEQKELRDSRDKGDSRTSKDLVRQISKEAREEKEKEVKKERNLRDLRIIKSREESNQLKESKYIRETRAIKQAKQLQKQSLLYSQSMDNRPVRSCRLKSDYRRERPNEMKEEQNHSVQIGQVIQEPEEQQPPEEVDYHPIQQTKRILDYDYLVQLQGRLNLISPAVIPSNKPKIEQMVPSLMPTFSMPPRVQFKEMPREPYSSEEYKESEGSEFVLDERGKQKRKKQKMMREQQRLSKKKKSRRIKKKHRSNNHGRS